MRPASLVLLALLAGACTKPATAPVPEPAPEVPAAEMPSAAAPAPVAETKPGINDGFLDPEMDVERWVKRFEAESREVVARQPAILEALALQPGEAVADVGAGTGLYMGPFAERVGAEGKVYAVDISPGMLAHLRQRKEQEGLSQVEVIEGTTTSTQLPEAAVDVVFICDTYHHFETPDQTLASLHAAMKPGARLFLLDFEREEGVSRDWILDHVRAGKEVFAAEIEAAGFTRDAELEVGLEENYLVRFLRE